MAKRVVVAGSAKAVRNALAALDHAYVVGAVVMGAGEVDCRVLGRAPNFSAADFSGISADILLIAAALGSGAEARTVLAAAADARLKVSLFEDGAIRRLRLDDLIGNPLDHADDARIRDMVEGKRVLITGGGGSIGAELAHRVTAFAPERLTLLDSSEFNLFTITQKLPQAIPVLADIRDASAVRRWFERERPQIVFHAAALKQVPLVEAFPSEGVLTNIGGLRHVAEACAGVGADLVFVSTDKAVEPSGAMGATKRIGELYCQALDRRGPRRAIPVRLGNVLGSAGSVAPTFEAQLAAGGPLTVTDPEVTRFFVTIPQAAESLLRAGAAGLSVAARGVTMVLDMGEALAVVELAREVIRLEGLRPGVDVPLVFTGLRPGEKLHELLIGSDERQETAAASGVTAAISRPRGLAEMHESMERLCLLAREGANQALREELFAVLQAPVEIESREAALAS